MTKDTKATDYEKAIISGHYIFSEKKLLKLRKNSQAYLKKKIKI
jgi:hypothetical protein